MKDVGKNARVPGLPGIWNARLPQTRSREAWADSPGDQTSHSRTLCRLSSSGRSGTAWSGSRFADPRRFE